MRLLVWVSSWLPYLKIMNLPSVFEENEEDMYKQIDFLELKQVTFKL